MARHPDQDLRDAVTALYWAAVRVERANGSAPSLAHLADCRRAYEVADRARDEARLAASATTAQALAAFTDGL